LSPIEPSRGLMKVASNHINNSITSYLRHFLDPEAQIKHLKLGTAALFN